MESLWGNPFPASSRAGPHRVRWVAPPSRPARWGNSERYAGQECPAPSDSSLDEICCPFVTWVASIRIRGKSAMPSRPVHWSEGMFLRPQHFQAADRYAGQALADFEDWYHPFNWGIRRLELDRDAIGNYSLVVRDCEARFKDGTKLTIPGTTSADPVELRTALAGTGAVTAYLAVPSFQPGRANVEERPTADGPR